MTLWDLPCVGAGGWHVSVGMGHDNYAAYGGHIPVDTGHDEHAAHGGHSPSCPNEDTLIEVNSHGSTVEFAGCETPLSKIRPSNTKFYKRKAPSEIPAGGITLLVVGVAFQALGILTLLLWDMPIGVGVLVTGSLASLAGICMVVSQVVSKHFGRRINP